MGVGEDARLGEDDDGGQEDGHCHPDELFAMLHGEVEEHGVLGAVARGIDVEPAEEHEGEPQPDGEPVDFQFLLIHTPILSF